MGCGGSRPVAPEGPRRIDIMEPFPSGCIVYEGYKEGEADALGLPLTEVLRGRRIDLSEMVRDKRSIVVGLPGAFTPICQRLHIPGYVQQANHFRMAGIDNIIVLCTNDVFCTAAFEKVVGAPAANIRFFADPRGEVALKLGLHMDARDHLGRITFRRFAALFEPAAGVPGPTTPAVLRLLYVEGGDGLGVSCSKAVPLLTEVLSRKYARIIPAGLAPPLRSTPSSGHNSAAADSPRPDSRLHTGEEEVFQDEPAPTRPVGPLASSAMAGVAPFPPLTREEILSLPSGTLMRPPLPPPLPADPDEGMGLGMPMLLPPGRPASPTATSSGTTLALPMPLHLLPPL